MSGWTLALQAVNFLILAAVLHRFLWKPVTAMIARRQQEIEAASKEAEKGRQAAEESRAHYEREVQKLGEERERLVRETRAELDKEHEQRLRRARDEAAAIVKAARGEIERERQDAAGRLTEAALGLGTDVARRLLEQTVGASTAEALLGRVCEHLAKLPADRLQSLREELGSSAASLVVATAPALDADAVARWAARITERLGDHVAVRFVADEELVAGAELRFPRTTLSFSWRDALRVAREELTGHVDRR